MAEIIRIIIVNGGELTNGAAGLTGIFLIPAGLSSISFVVIITILVLNFLRSATVAKQSLFVKMKLLQSQWRQCYKMKVIIFVIGAMISAIAGSLYVSYIGTVVPKDFTIMKSIDYLIIAVLGGLGSITGTIIAAVVLGIINMFLQTFPNLRMIIYALALILVMLFRPGGAWNKRTLSQKFFNKSKEGKIKMALLEVKNLTKKTSVV